MRSDFLHPDEVQRGDHAGQRKRDAARGDDPAAGLRNAQREPDRRDLQDQDAAIAPTAASTLTERA